MDERKIPPEEDPRGPTRKERRALAAQERSRVKLEKHLARVASVARRRGLKAPSRPQRV